MRLLKLRTHETAKKHYRSLTEGKKFFTLYREV